MTGFCMFSTLPVFFGGRPRGLPPVLLAVDCMLLDMESSDVIARLTIDVSLACRFASGSSSSSSEK